MADAQSAPVAEKLVGVHCASCSATFFPLSESCPRCGSLEVTSRALATGGAVVSVTTVGPNIVGEVRLEDGVRVLAAIDAPDVPAVGARVRHVPDSEKVRFEIDA